MLTVRCDEVDASMPGRLRERVERLLVSRGADASPCGWAGRAGTMEELLQLVTDHVKEQHAMRSWPPEYWVHIKGCVRECD